MGENGRFACEEASHPESCGPWLPSPSPRPEGRPLGILRLFHAQRRAMTTLAPLLDPLINRAPAALVL